MADDDDDQQHVNSIADTLQLWWDMHLVSKTYTPQLSFDLNAGLSLVSPKDR